MVWLKENQEQLADKLVALLEKTHLLEISDIMLEPPEMKYDAIKARLLSVRERRQGRDSGWLLELLTEMGLDDQKPSCLLQRMRNIVKYAAADVPDTTLRSMWMDKLTMDMQTAIIIMETLRSSCTLDDLAEVADNLIDFGIFDKQLLYLKKHNMPSQMLNNMQMLKYDTPGVLAFHSMMNDLPSYMKIPIAIRMIINSEFTVEDLEALARKTEELQLFNVDQRKKLVSLLDYGKPENETDFNYITRMMSTSASNITPLHVWMKYLPPHVRTAIAIRQAFDSNWTCQELAKLADKISQLKQPKK